MKNDLVSIIVPCYNASEFILDTLNSILSQSYINIQLIVVNDGSTDNSEIIVDTINDSRLQYYFQENKGVSYARNYGLSKATGNYVIFFDSDDIMPIDFIISRINCYKKSKRIDAVCGPVKKFNQDGFIAGNYRGPDSENLLKQILFYFDDIITCPSNFIFKRDFLVNNNLKFNVRLSSTADRFFLIECSKFGVLFFDKDISPLNYRVNSLSMSNKLTKSLVIDNQLFYDELKRNMLVPNEYLKKCLFLGYYMLSGANYKLNNYYLALKFGVIAFTINPFNFIKKKLFKKHT